MDLLLTFQSLFVVSLVSFLLYLYSKNYQSSRKPMMYGFRSYPIIGHLPHLIRNRHRFLEWVTESLLQSPTHTMGFWSIGTTSWIFTGNPTNVEHMLKVNSSNYLKSERTILMMEDLLGHGIFNSEGEEWRWQRKTASFEFNKKSLRNFVVDTVYFEISNHLLPILNQAAEKGLKIDLQDVLQRFAFDNICMVVFGENPACLAVAEEEEHAVSSSSNEFMAAFSDAQDISAARFLELFDGVWRIKKFLNTGTEKRLKKAIFIVHRYIMNIIHSRISRGIELGDRVDMVSCFASNKKHNEIVLRDVVTNFILAGRETTSTALTWFFWQVSTRPDVQKNIIDDINFVRTSNRITTDKFCFDDLRNMNYLHAAITESMRLYPPLAMDMLTCQEDDVMPDGTFVGKGWSVCYSAYAMGRSEDIWGKDCMDFKPERWLDENGVFKPENPFRYPVFHAGPRTCLGKEMAYLQMKCIVACILERFQITTFMKEGIPEHVLSLTRRMKGGFPVQLSKREDY